MSGHTPWKEIERKVSKPWYRFGWESFSVLYRRTMSRRPRPIFRSRMMWQRSQRGWSNEDAWSFHFYLANVISGGVKHLREIQHGHPSELTSEAWTQVLLDIELGMQAALKREEQGYWDEGGNIAFYFGMSQMKTWWFHLWD